MAFLMKRYRPHWVIAAVIVALGSGTVTPSRGEAPALLKVTDALKVTAVEVAAERDLPQVCFTFGSPLDKARGQGYAAFVEVAPPLPALSVVARDRALCVEGLAHGAAYRITLGQGLPGAGGHRLAVAETHAIEVPNLAPALSFRGGGVILPRVGPEGLPVRAINVDHVRLRVLSMGDRALVEKIYAGRVGQTLSDWDISELVEKGGKAVWTGELPLTAQRNTPITATFPLAPLLDGLAPGVYIATAASTAPEPNAPTASQWFVISDLGLTSFFGEDGLTVFARSLTSALPLAGVELHLLARNGKELGKGHTGADGILRFAANITRRAGDDTAQALFAYGGIGEFSFLDLAAPGVDLSGRGAGGRTTHGPLDAFIATERAIYRPGETVSLTTLLRDHTARAVPGRSWLLKLWRSDGVEADRREVQDAGAGGGTASFPLRPNTLPGVWSITAHIEPEGPAIGRAEFTVHELLPPRLTLALTVGQPALTPGATGPLTIKSRTQFWTPAAHLPGELSLTILPTETPFAAHDGYHFGLAQEKFSPIQTVLPGFTTDGDGKAEAELPALKLPDSSRPLQAVIRGTIFDIGGRAVSQELALPIHHQPFLIGLHPRFESEVLPEGATAAFDVIALAPDGTAIDKADLSYELFEEESEFRWFEANGHWDYETIIHDHRVTGATLTVGAGKPAAIEEPLRAGRYRLEVFDPKSAVASSIRFSAGWWAAPAAANRPDKVLVSVMRPQSHDDGVAHIHIRPPYDSQVVIAIADRSVRQVITRQIGADGATLDIPVAPDWSAGMTIIATAYAAVDSARKTAPRRAIGIGWLPVDPQPRTLKVKIDAPPMVEPRRPTTVTVAVKDALGAALSEGSPTYFTLVAVDEAVFQATEQPAPDPVAYYLGQRRLGVELRDVYGRLLDPERADAAPAASAPAKKERLRPVPGLPGRDTQVVTLFSGVVKVGADGTAQVPLAIPNFDGRLRLLALAWNGTRIGHAESSLAVHDQVRADIALPRFLAPGDRAMIEIGLTNLTAPPGEYQVALTTEGGVSVADGRFAVGIKKGRHVDVSRQLSVDHPGPAAVLLEITGPENYHLIQRRPVKVRSADRPLWRHSAGPLAPNETLTPPANLFEGLRADATTAAVTVGPLPALDLPGLVMMVDRPLHGNVEEIASAVIRLLAGGSLVTTLTLESQEALHDRIQGGLDRLVGQQHGDGGFPRWSLKEDSDPVLTPFVADSLDRASAAGYKVSAAASARAHEWLKRQLDNGWSEDHDLPERAYGTYVLAKAKSLDAGAVHYFHETFGPRLTTAPARAEIAAALASVGDDQAAHKLFDGLTTDLLADTKGQFSLRDIAATIALGAESEVVPHERLHALAERAAQYTPNLAIRPSANELAWLALAARAISDHTATPELAHIVINDEPFTSERPLYRRLDPATPLRIHNAGPTPISQLVSVVGLPAAPEEAAAHGFTLSRTLFDLDGKPLKNDTLQHHDLIVVILEGRATEASHQRIVISDLLPAGLDIETVRFADSPQLGNLSWLGTLSLARYADYRRDRFLAALDLEEGHPGFRVVYLARAVTRGDFMQAGATVEKENDPAHFARTAPGRLQISGEKN